MSSPGIESALSQMQSLASQAAGQSDKGQHVTTSVGQGGFADELQASIRRVNELQQTANSQAEAFQAGDPGVELNDVMVDLQKASVAFEMGKQVRSRLVTAYKDIMNMQV
ncbi:flagellar hook-basal body complex protein FliE [Billgrantia gudaonensis]|uniref:Flagellar hook-basal body complex protein FliE n=1 Tax=Billgrantia gudaonensis TaxID=376427 RepID=A0A1G8T0T8_9GAMM|nr:flagellar hook-basal body complex protein FliE [Halomonas gudaonensis]SDJ35182.1 flagellar hook-basal body complex protein FliE [Halomonas gudaonensis]